MCFQLSGDEVPLSDYVGFDARGTADAEGRRGTFFCLCKENVDGAVAAVSRGTVGLAVLDGFEYAAMAAGETGFKGSATHRALAVIWGSESVLELDGWGKGTTQLAFQSTELVCI